MVLKTMVEKNVSQHMNRGVVPKENHLNRIHQMKSTDLVAAAVDPIQRTVWVAHFLFRLVATMDIGVTNANAHSLHCHRIPSIWLWPDKTGNVLDHVDPCNRNRPSPKCVDLWNHAANWHRMSSNGTVHALNHLRLTFLYCFGIEFKSVNFV